MNFEFEYVRLGLKTLVCKVTCRLLNELLAHTPLKNTHLADAEDDDVVKRGPRDDGDLQSVLCIA